MLAQKIEATKIALYSKKKKYKSEWLKSFNISFPLKYENDKKEVKIKSEIISFHAYFYKWKKNHIHLGIKTFFSTKCDKNHINA
jgi:hypothetical protein